MKSFAVYLLFLEALLSGCGRSSPTTYYLLESGSELVTVDGVPKKTLRVAQVETPAYLGRNNIVSRVEDEPSLVLAEFHLWAEPVSNGVRRVVAETLTEPLLARGLYVLPTGTEEHGDYVLVIDVQRLDANFDQKAILDARWALLDRDDRPLERGIFSAGEQVDGKGYSCLVRAESRLLRKFASHLSETLPARLSR